jgi:diguanylate cyclase (GGDEF)-like protein
VGRDPGCDILLNDEAVSRRHAEIYFNQVDNTVWVTDLQSTNGTYLNGKRISSTKGIGNDDVVRIGRILFSFISPKLEASNSRAKDATKTIVTGDLVLEAVDNYSVLLHDIGDRLVSISELPPVFEEISVLIKRIIGGKTCIIVTADDFPKISRDLIPEDVFKNITEENSASIYDATIDNPAQPGKKDVQEGAKIVVPIEIDGQVGGLIYAEKAPASNFPFNKNDLQILVAISHQITLAMKRNQLEATLIHNAAHDSLTGLPNRSALIEQIDHNLDIARRRKDYQFAVLFLDVDNFKVMNDTYGHEVGDKILQNLADRLLANLRKVDTLAYFGSVARFGGDEFAILLTELKEGLDPLIVAERICKIAAEPMLINEREIQTSVSIGLAIYKSDYQNGDEMIRDADIAMYRAKRSGKDRVELYNKDFHNNLLWELENRKIVKKAVESNEFRIHYQPIVSLKEEKIIGTEALLRWYTADGQVIPAMDFIQILEKIGQLAHLNQRVFARAIEDTMNFQKVSDLGEDFIISVNFSYLNICDRNFILFYREMLESCHLSPRSIWIEITEDTSFKNDVQIQENLNQLKSLGSKIFIDDFGTGYSSINYLIDLPIDGIKIDKSIIRRIATDIDSYKIAQAIASMAKGLGKEIVVEGVEDERQWEMVRTLACDFIQGYKFSPSIPSEKVEEILKKTVSPLAAETVRYMR